MIADGCGSSGGSEVVRFRSSGVAGVLVNNGAGVTAHRWLKVAFIPSHLVKATFSHHRTTSEATTVTPTTSAPPRTPPSHQKSHTHRRWGALSPRYGSVRPPSVMGVASSSGGEPPLLMRWCGEGAAGCPGWA